MTENSEREMSLVGHLSELRVRLIISIAALFVAICLSLFVAGPVLDLLTFPIHNLKREPGRDRVLTIHVAPDGTFKIPPSELAQFDPAKISHRQVNYVYFDADKKTTATLSVGEPTNQGVYARNPLAGFLIPLKVAFIVGILLALPVILYQIWLFVAPGLKPKERQLVKPLLFGAVFLFPIGAMFAFMMVSMMMKVLQHYMPPSIEPLIGIDEYLSLLTTMMVVFGVIFELPLIVALGARIGIVTPEMLARNRRIAYVVLTIAAAIITPADPFSMIVGLVPMVLLYELSIIAARPMARMRRGDSEETEAEAS
ncbi:twin-arginine translocase subunit TatC [bacterium]|nr:twin-arginine translocase subunit TatC [bacterium]